MNRVVLSLAVVAALFVATGDVAGQVSQVLYYAPSGAVVQPVPVTSYYGTAPTTVYYSGPAAAPVAYAPPPTTVYYPPPRTVYYQPAPVVTTAYRPLVGGITRVRYAPVTYAYPTTVYYRY